MSGHSKWAQIKYKKALTDAKKGKIFSKLSRFITIAAKDPPAGGGPDPKTNYKLASAIEDAKAANMPQENISRAMDRAKEKDASQLKEVLYEVYGPSGSALIITTVTDNSNRTINEIKMILSENGAKLGEQGSAMWAFDRRSLGEGGYIPKFPMALSEEDNKKLENLLSALDDQDDVQEVYTNTSS